MRTLLLIFSLLWASSTFGQIKYYPDSLAENANEVILKDDTWFKVENIKKSKLKRSYKTVILNSRAEEANQIRLFYNDFRKVKYAQVKTTDLIGRKKGSWSLSDFRDISTKGYSLASDSRVKYLEVIHNEYPYIIEVEYEIDYTGSLFYPTWIPQGEKQAVMNASLRIESAEADMFRYQSLNIEPKAESLGLSQIVEWEVKNLQAFEFERYSYRYADYTPVVYSAPNQFQMDGVQGDLSTWESFGQWINQLNSGRNDLLPEQLAAVKKLIPADASIEEKARIVYDYLQENSRYVSIQLGIGGWQPFTSSFVHEKKYGDCKALSFYTQSLLEAIDVPSFYTLINAGSNASRLSKDFPMNKFNHAILTVPTEQDTIWLECTSQTNPFGYLGMFTSDRDALMITPEGGKVIHTRRYKEEENVQATNIHVTIDDKGVGQVAVDRTYQGIEIENDRFNGANRLSEDKQRKWFVDEHEWGQMDLETLEVSAPTEAVVPTAQMKASLSIRNMANSSSNRLFFKPFTFTNISGFNMKPATRSVPMEIRYAFSQVDTIQVNFPEQYFIESASFDKKIDSEFGSYEIKMINDEGKLTFVRKCVINNGIYQPEEYAELRTFIRNIQKSDNKRLVMLNRT
ncbi:MAG: DUF3857 domain-containing protein [Cytophagales bacterium]|nr:DUF3857 domain-containing protein [Cytophagales bacterium]